MRTLPCRRLDVDVACLAFVVSLLSGFKIPHIENLGVTNDEYEVIDISDNELTKLDNLPLLSRLTMLLLSNNRISKLALELNRNVPHLESLVSRSCSAAELTRCAGPLD
jgi:U2 small nuclear ribonucleoprotein A'